MKLVNLWCIVRKIITNCFYESIDDVSNKNIFFQSLGKLNNFNNHNTSLQISFDMIQNLDHLLTSHGSGYGNHNIHTKMDDLMKVWIFDTHIHHPLSHFYIHPTPINQQIKIASTLLLTSNGSWSFNHNRSKCIKIALNNFINNL
jgi:hypothetical protein